MTAFGYLQEMSKRELRWTRKSAWSGVVRRHKRRDLGKVLCSSWWMHINSGSVFLRTVANTWSESDLHSHYFSPNTILNWRLDYIRYPVLVPMHVLKKIWNLTQNQNCPWEASEEAFSGHFWRNYWPCGQLSNPLHPPFIMLSYGIAIGRLEWKP